MRPLVVALILLALLASLALPAGTTGQPLPKPTTGPQPTPVVEPRPTPTPALYLPSLEVSRGS
jgi:hypothetical protein